MFTHKQISPRPELDNYIYSISIIESGMPMSFKILPQPNAVLTIKFKGSMFSLDNGERSEVSSMNICGPYDNFKQRVLDADTGIIVIKLKEGSATGLFDFPIHELFSGTFTLNTFFAETELQVMEEKILLADAYEEKVKVLEDFLCAQINGKGKDDLVWAATRQIREAKGGIRIKDLCRQLYISESQFEKRFKRSVGTSAKKFSSLVRIEQILSDDERDASITERAYEAGYFDQAHFIRDFKSFTGLTPHQFFRLRPKGTSVIGSLGLADLVE